MKRLFAVLICFTIFCSLTGCSLGEQNKEVIDENFYCKVIDENNIAIGNVKTYPKSGAVFFPEQIENYTVSKIGFSSGLGFGGNGYLHSSGESGTVIERCYFPRTIKEVSSDYMKLAGNLKIFYCGEVIDLIGLDAEHRNVETDSGLPLRGKSLNVRDLPKSKVMDNAEIMAVMAAMGLKFGESPIAFDNKGNIVEDKTRFGQIHIYTDADVDGTACAALILNYIHKFWPDLIRAHKIARAETPIIIVEHKKTKKEKWFYYDSEYKDWCSGKDLKDYDIHYMKGLGALNDKQSKEIFQNPHLYYYELDDFAEDSMQIWFGKDSEMRKKKLV